MASTTPQFGLSSIGQIFVRAKDLDRAVRFYRDTLGMPFLFQVPRMAFFQCGATMVMLGIAETGELDHAASLIYYLVPDIALAHAALPPPACRAGRPTPGAAPAPALPPLGAAPSDTMCRIAPGPAAKRDTVAVALAEPIDPTRAPQPRNDAERFVFAQLYETLIRV